MEEQFRPLMISNNNNISHSLFVDDILILGMLCHFSWLCLFNILKKITNAIGLQINERKSIIYRGKSSRETIEYIEGLYCIKETPIQKGMKYL